MTTAGVEDEPEILIVEDDESAADGLGRELKRLGFRSVVVETESDAVKKLDETKPIGVAVDIHLGQGHSAEGISIIRYLKMTLPPERRPFVAALTSHSEREAEAIDAGADGFIIKRRVRHDALRFVLELQAKTVDREQARGRLWFRSLLDSDIHTLQSLLTEQDADFAKSGGTRRAQFLVDELLGAAFIREWEAAILSALRVQLQRYDTTVPTIEIRRVWSSAARLLLKDEDGADDGLGLLSATGEDILMRWFKDE